MRYAIGVDLGGTNIRAALVNEEGVILQVIKEKTIMQLQVLMDTEHIIIMKKF